jgi:hypothetical protein
MFKSLALRGGRRRPGRLCGQDGRPEPDRPARRPHLLQPGGVQPGRPDRREGHRPDLRAGRGLSRPGAAGAPAQLLRPRRRHDQAVRRGPQPRRGRNAVHRPAVAAFTRRQSWRGPGVLGGRPAALGPVPSRRRPRRGRCPCPARRGAAAPDAAADGPVAGQHPRRRHRHRLVSTRGGRRPHRRARRVANGQFAELLIVPERDFAVVALANAGPDGTNCNQAVVRWALEVYLG